MRRWLLAVGLLGLAAPAFGHEVQCPVAGSDGQAVAALAGTTETTGKIASNSSEVFAHWLCCNRGAGACTDLDGKGGPASRYVVSLEDVGTCTGVSIDVGFREMASGVNHIVGTLTLTTDSLVIDGPRPRFVTAVVNTMAGCGADNADVWIGTYHARINP